MNLSMISYSRIFFVDTENQGTQYVEDLNHLGFEDKVILMYTDYAPKFGYPQIESFINSKATIITDYCFSGTPNALDFQISSRIGAILKEIVNSKQDARPLSSLMSAENVATVPKIYLVTNDTGYYPLIKYWNTRGYELYVRNTILGDDIDVDSYLNNLSISKQLETQKAYLNKANVTLAEASVMGSLPPIKTEEARHKVTKKVEERIVRVREVPDGYRKVEIKKESSEETESGMYKVSGSPEINTENITRKTETKTETTTGPDGVITNTFIHTNPPVGGQLLNISDVGGLLEEKVNKDNSIFQDTTLAEDISKKTDVVGSAVEEIEGVNMSSELFNSQTDTKDIKEERVDDTEISPLDVIFKSPKSKMEKLIPLRVEALTEDEKIGINNNTTKIRGVVKCTKHEALLLGYLAYFSKTSDEFGKGVYKIFSAKDARAKASNLVNRFNFGFLVRKYKEESK